MDILKSSTGDINSLEDRLWACANIISLEEHNYSSWLRTKDEKWLADMNECRVIRQQLMSEILGEGIRHGDAEIWCMFKHNAGAAFRLWESGNRYSKEDPERAKKYYDMSKNRIGVMLALIEYANGEPKQLEEYAESLRDKPIIKAEKHKQSEATVNQDTKKQVQAEEDNSLAQGDNINTGVDKNDIRSKAKKVLEYLKCCL